MLMFAVFLIAACSEQSRTLSTSIQLKWVHQAEFAGFYVAADTGIYAEHGIEVEIREGGKGISPLTELINGNVDFAVVGAEELVLARARGESVKAVAVIYQRSPVVFLSRMDAGLTSPESWPGHSVAYSDFSSSLQFRAILGKLGIPAESVVTGEYDYSLDNLIAGKVDITSAYYIGGYLRRTAKGDELAVTWPADYGVDIYGDTLVTRDDLIDSSPELVAAVVAASLEGWARATSRTEEAVEATLVRAREQDRQLQTTMLNLSFPLLYVDGENLGAMSERKWAGTIDLMERHVGLESSPTAAEVATMRFIDQESE